MNVTQLLGYQPTLYVCDGHGLETAGKRTPTLPNGTFIHENQFNSPTAKRFGAAAIEAGFLVIYVAPTDIDTPLKERTDKANADFKLQQAKYPHVPEDKLAIYLSIHFNALNGVFDSKAGGVESFYYPASVAGKKLADCLQAELLKGTKQVDRKVKSADFHVLRETNMTAALVECGFMDKLEEANLMLSPAFQQETAIDALRGVCSYLGLKYAAPIIPTLGTPILSSPRATVGQAQEWARGKSAPQAFIDLAQLYWKLAPLAGVDPVLAYAQFGHETGYLYRDGKSGAGLDASYCNPCGLKTTIGGGDTQSSAHTRFKDWSEGITAHVDHLALYAGAVGYPKADTPDPRHFPYLLGTAKNVEQLSGKWAPSATYGVTLVKFVEEIRNTKVTEVKPQPVLELSEAEKIKAAVKIIADENGVADPDYWIEHCVKGTPIDGAYVGSLIKNMGRIITRLKG